MEVSYILVIVCILNTSPAERSPAPQAIIKPEISKFAFVKTRRAVTSSVLNLTVTLTNISEFCPGGNIGLENTDLKVQYRSNHTGGEWITLNDTIPPEEGSSWLLLPEEPECVEVRLLQEEHGGGKCNCWSVSSSIMDGSQ